MPDLIPNLFLTLNLSHNPLKTLQNCEDQPRCLPLVIEMCIWAHTITTILKKTPHNSVWRCAYLSLVSVLQVLLLKDKKFPDHVNQHSWPLFSAQLPLLSSLTSLRLDPIPVSTNWQTNNKQKKIPGLLCVFATSTHDRIDIYITAAEHYKFNSKFAFCWLTQQTQRQANPVRYSEYQKDLNSC